MTSTSDTTPAQGVSSRAPRSAGPSLTSLWGVRDTTRSDLDRNDIAVLDAVVKFMGADGWSRPGAMRIARVQRMGLSTVKASLAKLKSLGVLIRGAGGLDGEEAAPYRINVAELQPGPRRFRRSGMNRKKLSASKRFRVYTRDGFACRYCRVTDDLTLDHVVPRRYGGSHRADNLVTACRRCNARKGARTPEQAGMTLLEVPS